MQEDKKFRSGFVAIIGRPNVGKSTLMNCIIGQKIAIMSSKAQTTRKRIETVYTNDEGQIVFLDTPGMNRSRNKLGDFMVNEVSSAFSDADVVMWIIEPGDRISAGEQEIAEKLAGVKKPVILVINKVDVNTDEEVFKTIDIYKDVLDFTDIVPVSALREKNREELINVIIKNLPEGPMYYDEDTVTEETERDICAELIREQALQKLDKEIPHGIAVEIDTMKVRPDGRITDIEATIICERDSHKGIIIGKGGAMLKRIGTGARIEMEKLLMTKVNLKLFVKVRRDWRDNQNMLRNFGYSDKR
ncbi:MULTISPECIES: GTPase Era [Eubacterium]|jgi:GTP-binding protein Era|uniref:GTPase Era n=1 Tax=Eubacterium TaxID=1730 RepID=UPI0015695342|nr:MULTISPECIES: GTPase Era [Eubacterium]MCR5368627.1 GTPase Era [Eubacterium sp.]